MAVMAAGAGIWDQRRRRVADLLRVRGFAGQLLDFYGALLGVQEKAFVDVQTTRPPSDSLVAYVAEMVVPSVVDVSAAVGPDRLRSEVITRFEAGDSADIISRWMRGDDQSPVDRFLARASLGPVLEALGAEARAQCAGPRDSRHCPGCGGLPQLGFFDVAADDLATGPRHLVCARCDSTWGYPRMTCASCGEDSSAKLNVFSEYGTTSGERGSVVRGLPGAAKAPDPAVFPHMRIEACDSCRRYLLSVDLAVERAAVPVVDELSAIPLDLYARDLGYTKVIANLMGF
jgi:hypothetical protein